LTWVEDESNQDTRFDRNFVRHNIAPQLQQRWPHITKSIQRSSELCAEQEALLDELLTDKLTEAVHADGSLMVEALMEVSRLMRARLIRMWLAQFSVRMPSREQLNLIWHQVASAQQDANPSLNLPDGEIRRFAHRLFFVTSFNDVSNWQSALYVNQSIRLPDELGCLTLSTGDNGKLSLDALSVGVLSVQFNPEGLSAHPAKRGHSRKLKKLFQEYAIPSWQRRRMPILMCGDKVAAIADLFIDRDFVGQDCELIWDKSPIVV
jgi:tRNA(Ile)-lysidine synthase